MEEQINAIQIYDETIKRYFEVYQEQQTYVKMSVLPTDELKNLLPPEAFVGDVFRLDFDFENGSSYILDNIVIEDLLFKCMVVYPDGEEFNEILIEFPIAHIISLTHVNLDRDISNTSRSLNEGISEEQIAKSKKSFTHFRGVLINRS